MFLTDDEIYELTGKRQRALQCAALDLMGIRYEPRPDGKPRVLRSVLERRLVPSVGSAL